MPSFKLSAKAKIDLKKIAFFTEKRWGRVQRNAYLLQFDQCFHQLADNPAMGTTCDKVRTGYRQFPQGSHLIFYKISDKDIIEIIRILHKNMVPKLQFLNA
jgi:toxin ParE1/3/4